MILHIPKIPAPWAQACCTIGTNMANHNWQYCLYPWLFSWLWRTARSKSETQTSNQPGMATIDTDVSETWRLGHTAIPLSCSSWPPISLAPPTCAQTASSVSVCCHTTAERLNSANQPVSLEKLRCSFWDACVQSVDLRLVLGQQLWSLELEGGGQELSLDGELLWLQVEAFDEFKTFQLLCLTSRYQTLCW